jgi:hypothetical protein
MRFPNLHLFVGIIGRRPVLGLGLLETSQVIADSDEQNTLHLLPPLLLTS